MKMQFKTTTVQLPYQMWKDLNKKGITFAECMRVGATFLLSKKSCNANTLQLRRRVDLIEKRLVELLTEIQEIDDINKKILRV